MSDGAEDSGLVKFLIDSGVLLFGDFQLKSGRESPYFFNLGSINTGLRTSRLARRGYDVGWAFNRKEIKLHGEGGRFVGADIEGKILLVDDVLTAGSAVRESIALLDQTDAELVGVIVTMDRQECLDKQFAKTAVQQIEDELKVPVLSLLTLDDIIAFFKVEAKTKTSSASILSRLQKYRDEYGVN